MIHLMLQKFVIFKWNDQVVAVCNDWFLVQSQFLYLSIIKNESGISGRRKLYSSVCQSRRIYRFWTHTYATWNKYSWLQWRMAYCSKFAHFGHITTYQWISTILVKSSDWRTFNRVYQTCQDTEKHLTFSINKTRQMLKSIYTDCILRLPLPHPAQEVSYHQPSWSAMSYINNSNILHLYLFTSSYLKLIPA